MLAFSQSPGLGISGNGSLAKQKRTVRQYMPADSSFENDGTRMCLDLQEEAKGGLWDKAFHIIY